MKELKDYLHLYLGCDVEYSFTNSLKTVTTGHGVLKGVELTKESMEAVLYLPEIGSSLRLLISNVKPLLRPLESMTEYEIIWMFVMRAKDNGTTVDKTYTRTQLDGTFMQVEFKDGTSEYQDIKTLYPSQFTFLLSKHFDLFNLIPEGLALPIN